MDKLEGTSLDITKMNIEKLKELFPNVVTEGKINFDVLKTVLGEEVDDSKEKYQFTWKGKAKSIKIAQSPSSATLRPDKESSKNWDTTENLYIEGDNLEVLKQLQKTYFNKVKLIYIDPPYNTGKDFVYRDDFRDSVENYKAQTNQLSKSNPESNGRYHTDWLNMMYPRLMLAKNLLTEDGIILINMDENEISNLQKICIEVFGEANDLGTIVWDKRNPKGDAKGISYQHEYILVYAKNKVLFREYCKMLRPKKNAAFILKKASQVFSKISSSFSLADANSEFSTWMRQQNDFSGGEKAYNKIDEHGEVYRPVSMAWPNKKKAPDDYFIPLIHPITKKPCPVPDRGWRNPSATMKKMLEEGRILFGKDETTIPNSKYLLSENMYEKIPSLLYYGGSDTDMLAQMGIPFDTPKVVDVCVEHINSFTGKDDIIMDFFSGSASVAHAVMQQNVNDCGNRKFIMVQLPEICDEKSEAFKAGYKNICEIGKERIRRAGEKVKKEWEDEHPTGTLFDSDEKFDVDIGFKVFKLDSTNIVPWDSELELDEKSLAELTSKVFKQDRTKEDILYEIMLKYGIFDQKVSEVSVNNKTLYQVGRKYMIVCLEDEITIDDVKAIAELQLKTVVFKESGFKNDNDKINAVYNLEQAGVEDIKCI